MRKSLLSAIIFITSLNANAMDPFSVYQKTAPENCIDKSVFNESMGLPELIEIGVCNNPTLNRGYMEVKTYEAEYGKSKSEYLPSVDLLVDISDTYTKYESEKSKQKDPYGANIALSWLIYDFGGRGARAERAKKYLESAGFAYNAQLHDTVLGINNAYFELLGAQEVLKSAKISEESFKKSYEESSKRYELGLVALSDKLLAKTSYEESRLETVQAKNSVQQAQGRLAQLLNVEPTTKFNLKKPKNDKDLTKLEMGEISVDEMIKTALSLRPEIKNAQAEVEIAQANIEIAQAQNMPSISLNAKGGYNDDMRYSNPHQQSGSIGVNLSVPLFTGFSNSYNISSAKYQKKKSLETQKEQIDIVKNEVWTAYNNYKTAVASHKISKKALESAIENEKVAFASYQVGKGDILNLLTAGSQLSTARKEVIVAYYSVLTSKANLYKAIGRF